MSKGVVHFMFLNCSLVFTLSSIPTRLTYISLSMFVQFLVWFALFLRQCSMVVHVVILSSSLVSLFSPHGIVTVEGDEEAEDSEEHDGVGCENKATSSSSDLQVSWSSQLQAGRIQY